MNIQEEDYQVAYKPETETVIIQGSLELGGTLEYAPIAKLLSDVAEQKPVVITLDVRDLEFLNSSGITTLLQFAIKLRNLKASELVVLGRSLHAWQPKSLKNIQRFVPGTKLEFI